jgi:hypothetical protein
VCYIGATIKTSKVEYLNQHKKRRIKIAAKLENKMKINITNIEKVNSAIEEAEGKATSRTISVTDINELVVDIEKRLSNILNKKDWSGLTFYCDNNAQSFPAAYKFSPESTHVILERGASSWFITVICRGYCKSPSQRIVPQNIDTKQESIVEFIKQAKNW